MITLQTTNGSKNFVNAAELVNFIRGQQYFDDHNILQLSTVSDATASTASDLQDLISGPYGLIKSFFRPVNSWSIDISRIGFDCSLVIIWADTNATSTRIITFNATSYDIVNESSSNSTMWGSGMLVTRLQNGVVHAAAINNIKTSLGATPVYVNRPIYVNSEVTPPNAWNYRDGIGALTSVQYKINLRVTRGVKLS